MPKQDPRMEISSTVYDCGECGFSFLDRVFLDTDGGTLEWLACCRCGWDDRPDEYEPDDFYEARYAG